MREYKGKEEKQERYVSYETWYGSGYSNANSYEGVLMEI